MCDLIPGWWHQDPSRKQPLNRVTHAPLTYVSICENYLGSKVRMDWLPIFLIEMQNRKIRLFFFSDLFFIERLCT